MPNPLPTIAATAATAVLSASLASPGQAQSRVFFGTYDSAQSRGIYVSTWNAQTGDLGTPELAAPVKSPSYLALAPNKKFLLAVNESGTSENSGGAVSLFAIDPATGKLKFLNEQPSRGDGPCHVSVSPDGKTVLAANYGGGSVASYLLQPEGMLLPAASFIQHEGRSVVAGRQEGPHAHSATFAPDGKFAVVCDLGADRIFSYRVFSNLGTIEPAQPPSVAVKNGSGPRHFAFHPNGKAAYVINELNSTISSLSYDPATGALQATHTTGTLPPGFSGQNSTAHVAVHPSGKWVYSSNRGHDSIARFATDPVTGWARFLDATPSGGKTPRNFSLDPAGRWLLAANQGSDNVTIFKINPETGELAPTGKSVALGKPVCVVFHEP
jgi:6-phosphogluconolactonase